MSDASSSNSTVAAQLQILIHMYLSDKEVAGHVLPVIINRIESHYKVPATHWAVECGNEKLLTSILDLGYNINCVTSVLLNKLTCLHYAVQGRNIEILKILLGRGADPDLQTAEGCTPLHMALNIGLEEAAVLLIRAGASYRLWNFYLECPWFLAIRRRQCKAIKEMILEGANASIKNYAGRTAMDIAEDSGCVEVITLVLGTLEHAPYSGTMDEAFE